MRYLLILAFGIGFPLFASGTTIRVRIYFLPWGLETNVRMRPEDVVNRPWMRTEILNDSYANDFILHLGLNHLKKGEGHATDIRLVIKADQTDGSTKTFVASRFEIEALESGTVWLLDDAFRKRFDVPIPRNG
jgi:hypothetical protein